MKKLVIIGAGGLGREVADTIELINRKQKRYDIIGFVIDKEYRESDIVNDIPVIGDREYLKEIALKDEIYAVVAIGGNQKKKKEIIEELDNYVKWETIIHPTAIISKYSIIEEGTICQENTMVGPNVKLGKHCLINYYSGLSHDVTAHDFCEVAPNVIVPGYVLIGEGAFIGIGSVIVPHIVVGEYSYICAGSVISKNINAYEKIKGNPACTIGIME